MKRILNRSQRRGLMLSLALWLGGLGCACGWLPDPTTRSVTLADLAGRYTYTVGEQTVTVQLNADGTFEIANSPTLTCSQGTWELNQAEITLECPGKYLVSGWYVTDGAEGAFAILGGEGDPDTWDGLQRVP